MIPANGGTGSGRLNPVKTNPRRKPPIRVGRRLENDITDLDPCVNGLEVAKPLLTPLSLLMKRVQQGIWGQLGDQSATWGDELRTQIRWMNCHSVKAIALVLTAGWILMAQYFDGYWTDEIDASSRRSHKYHSPLRDKVNDNEGSRRKRPWLFVQDTDQKAATKAALSGQPSNLIFSRKIIHHFMSIVLLRRTSLHPTSKGKWRKAKGISTTNTWQIEPIKDY